MRLKVLAVSIGIMFLGYAIPMKTAQSSITNLVHQHPISLGIYAGDGNSAMKQINDIEHKLDKRFPILHVYGGFNEGFSQFKQNKMDPLYREDSVFLVSWAPGVKQGILYNEIASGNLDNYLKEWAKGLKQWEKPVFIRFAYEMNMKNMAWNGTSENGGAESFKKAWQHIHKIFKEEGAANVSWVWCPHADQYSPNYTDLMQYYPGNDYVDWVGLDGYYWGGDNGHESEAFDRIFASSYKTVMPLNKPMMLAEIGAPSDSEIQEKWLREAFNKISTDYTQVHAVVYFNADFSSQGEKDWRMSIQQSSMDLFKAFMHSSRFNSNINDLTSSSIR